MFKTNQYFDGKVVSIGLESKARTGSLYKAIFRFWIIQRKKRKHCFQCEHFF
ncbi:MAG: hypothetical protein GZ091_02195 [Paludibacter sp.]|nr:hypothetical protein [Paludibacter sp.]